MAAAAQEGAAEDENWMRSIWGTVLCVGQQFATRQREQLQSPG